MTINKPWVCSCVSFCVAIVVMAFLAAPASANTAWQLYRYVDDNAPNDPGPGDPAVSDLLEDGSMEHPFDAIQEAIDAASDGDEVVIFEGTYTGEGNRDLDYSHGLPEGQTRAIIVRSTNPENPKVVAATVIDCQGSEAEPHRGFNFHTGETTGSILSGLTVTHGYGLEEEDVWGNVFTPGGAINCTGSSPTIENCVFSYNAAGTDGGAIYNRESSNPQLINCTFHENSANGWGGGLCNWDNSNPMLTHCTFIKNTAYSGGGMSNAESSPTIMNCSFDENSAGWGGGISNGQNSNPTMITCTFTRNSTSHSGGGMYNMFSNNPMLVNCTFVGSSAYYDGGGMHNYHSSPTLTNCTFSGNTVSSQYARGGGIYNMFSNPTLTNCTFSGNSADVDGGGMYNDSSEPTLTNCVLWNNTAPYGPQIANNAPMAIVTYCCIQGGYTGMGNISADPSFVRNPDPGPDGEWDGLGDDYGNLRLQPSSPCIDAGDNTAVPADTLDLDDDGDTAERIPFDLDSNLRFYDMFPPGGSGVADPPDYPAIVDMGAYEYLPWPRIVSAVSVKTHGTAGEFGIDVLDRTDDLDIEPRTDGVTTLVVAFDLDLQRVNNDLTDVVLSSGSLTAITVNPLELAELTIEMLDTVNGEPLTVSFPGIAYANDVNFVTAETLCIRQLVGDARSDGAINAADRVDVRNQMGLSVTADNFRCDVRADGSINAADRVDVRNAMGSGFAGSCSD